MRSLSSIPKGIAVACCVGSTCLASVITLPVDGAWTGKKYTVTNGNGVGLVAPDIFTFTAVTHVELRITDYTQTGERYSVFAGSDTSAPLLLTTPAVAFDAASTEDIDFAYHDPRWSHGQVTLAPGTYTLTVRQDADITGYTFWNLGLRVVSVSTPLGDMNCDGAVNGQDIDGFVLALFDPAAYAGQYPFCNILNGDMNGDGLANGQDIDGFVAALFGS